MPIPQPLLYNRGLIIVKVEATSRVDQIAIDTVDVLKKTHALLIENPQITPDITLLERANVRPDLSPDATRAGRRVGRLTFLKEVAGSGAAALAPRIGQVLQACGMKETARATTTTVRFDNIIQVARMAASTAVLSGAAGDGYTGSVFRSAILECTLGGGSGVATVSVTVKSRDGTNHFSAPGIVVTNATPIELGAVGDGTPTFIPTLVGSMVIGDKWQVDLLPTGTYYNPVSGDFETCTAYCYFGGGTRTILHKLVGCMGTWSATGKAGEYSKFSFSLTGDWTIPTNPTMPTGVDFGDIVPPVTELSDVYLADRGGSNPFIPANGLLCDNWSVDIANTVNLRSSIGDESGYVGSFIGARAPVATLDPEAVLESEHPFWGALTGADLKHFYTRVGTVAGNRASFYGPNVQYVNLGYGNRETLRNLALQLRLARSNGDDELEVAFT